MLHCTREPDNACRPAVVCRAAVTTLALVACAMAEDSPWRFGGNADIGGGYESNIFRRPSVMDTGTGQYDPRVHDGLLGVSGRLKATYSNNSRNRLQFRTAGNYWLYPANSSASQGDLQLGAEYRFRPRRTVSLTLSGEGSYHRDLGIDESSDGQTDLYEFLQVEAGSHLELEPSKALAIEAAYLFTYTDYTDDSAQPYDNQQHQLTASIAPRFGRDHRSSVTIQADYLLKIYRDLLSYDRNGNLLATSPNRTYHQISGSAELRADWGTVTWKLAERVRYRIDAFDDYYTYIENRLSSGLDFKFTEHTQLDVSGAWRYRKYTVHEAAVPGPNPLLTMHYLDASADFSQRLWKALWVWVAYDLALRNTNTGYESFRTYRDYIDHVARGGLRLEW